MAFIPVPATVQAELRYTMDNQLCENTLYFKYDTTPSQAELQTLANELFAWWSLNLKPITGAHCFLREIFCTDLSSINGPTHVRVSSPPVPGDVAFPPAPNSVSLTTTFRTNQRGRSFRGRNYFVGLTEGQIDGNLVQPGFVSALQAAYNLLISIAVPLGSQWVVVSRFTNGAPRVTGVATPIGAAAVVDNIVDSQRRRLPKRGL